VERATCILPPVPVGLALKPLSKLDVLVVPSNTVPLEVIRIRSVPLVDAVITFEPVADKATVPATSVNTVVPVAAGNEIVKSLLVLGLSNVTEPVPLEFPLVMRELILNS
jgi:hypothetical protein